MRNLLLNILVAVLDTLGVACLCYGLHSVWPPLSFIAFGGIALVAAKRLSETL